MQLEILILREVNQICGITYMRNLIKNDAKQRLSDERNDRRSSYEKASNRELRNEASHGSSIASRSRAQSELNRRQGK